MLRKKANLALLALMIPVVALTGCGKKGIIVVNGEKVSKDEFYSRLERIPVQTQQGTKLAGQYVVEQMIGEKLVEQLAKKQNVTPTDTQIANKIAFIRKESGGDMQRLLAAQGMNTDDLKKKISAEQSLINLYSKGVNISDAEVRAAYDQALNAKGSKLVRPEQVKTSVIIVEKKDKIDKVYKMLTGGADFGTTAMQMSEVPGANKDRGQLDWFSVDDPRPIPKEVKQNAFATPANTFSKPFTVKGGWVIVKVDSKRPKKVTQFEDIKEVIREQLAMQKASKTSKLNDDLKTFTKSATITVNAARYQGIPAMIKKQATNVALPKAGAGDTATPARATSP